MFKRYIVQRIDGSTAYVLLMKHKDGSGYSYVNMTKGHICPCKFDTIEDALEDMRNKDNVVDFEELERGDY